MPKIGLTELAPALAWPKYFYQGFNRQYFRKVLSYRPIAFWPLWEASGSVAHDISRNGLHGAYTDVTLGKAGIDGKRTCTFFDGANSFVNIYSSGFNTLFDGEEGTIMLWAKVFDAGVWTDGDNHMMVDIEVDGNNNFQLYKSSTNNTIRTQVKQGGTNIAFDIGGLSMTDWFQYVVTWSLTADETIAYVNTSPSSTYTGLGTWAGNLHADRCNIGSYLGAPALEWHGWIDMCSVFDRALTLTEITDLYSV